LKSLSTRRDSKSAPLSAANLLEHDAIDVRVIDRVCAIGNGPHDTRETTSVLEFHHVVPYAAGGQTTSENVELRCRAHNAYEAEQYFGPLLMREARASWGGLARSGPS
jgi:hypothetical protein